MRLHGEIFLVITPFTLRKTVRPSFPRIGIGDLTRFPPLPFPNVSSESEQKRHQTIDHSKPTCSLMCTVGPFFSMCDCKFFLASSMICICFVVRLYLAYACPLWLRWKVGGRIGEVGSSCSTRGALLLLVHAWASIHFGRVDKRGDHFPSSFVARGSSIFHLHF